MGTFDVYNRATVVGALNPAAARTTSTNGTSVSLVANNLGANGVMFAVIAGTITDGTHTFKIQDAVDSSGSPGSWNDVAAPLAQIPSVAAFTSSTTAGTCLKFGYLGIQPWVRLVCTVTGSPSTGGIYAAVAFELGNASLPAV